MAKNLPGEGATDALTRYFTPAKASPAMAAAAPDKATHLITWLWIEGYKVVKLTHSDVAKIEADIAARKATRRARKASRNG